MDQILEILSLKLSEVLDSEQTHLEMSLTALNEIRAGVVKKNENHLKQLLGIVGSEMQAYSNVQKQRGIICDQIANVTGIDASVFCLSALIERLDGSIKEEICQKQMLLQKLAASVREEYALTAMFLRECIKFNNCLLKSIFGDPSQATYNIQGKGRWQNGTQASQMVNMFF